MDDEDVLEKFEILLIELEYAITDFQYERECQATLRDAGKVALTTSLLASTRCTVELGLALLANFRRGEAEVVVTNH